MKLHQSSLINFKPAPIDFCETCILNKKTAIFFVKSDFKVNHPLEYVLFDLRGPTQTPTIGGRNYSLSILDHYTRKVWIFLLNNKNKAFQNIKIKLFSKLSA